MKKLALFAGSAGFLTAIPFQLLLVILSYMTNDVFYLAVIGAVQAAACLYVIYLEKREILSLTLCFMGFSYVLHFGHYALLLMGRFYTEPTYNIFRHFSEDILAEGAKILILAHACFLLGVLVSCNISFRHKRMLPVMFPAAEYQSDQMVRWVGVFLILAGLSVSVPVNVHKIQLMLSGGYYNTFAYTARTGGVISFLSYLWEAGALLLLQTNINSLKKKLILSGSVAYLLISMFTGGRMLAFMHIIVFFMIYLKQGRRKKRKNMIWYVVIGYVVISFVVNIGLARTSGFQDGFTLAGIGTLTSKVLGEFGGTMDTVLMSLEHIPKDIPYAGGKSYFYAIIMAFPNIGIFSDEAYAVTAFAGILSKFTESGLGGSYIGEAYYNFGMFYWAAMILTGIFVGEIEKGLEYFTKKGDKIRTSMIYIMFPYVFMWTRSYFKDLIRPLVWTGILIAVLYGIFGKVVKHGWAIKQGEQGGNYETYR